MPVEALAKLPKPKRAFVPETMDFSDWTQVQPLLTTLQKEGQAVESPAELEAWILKVSELLSGYYQASSIAYINMTCFTEDPACEKAYLKLVEELDPKLKPECQKLDEIYLASPHRKSLTQTPSTKDRWMVFDRETSKDVELFREANIPLQTQEAKLSQQYQKIIGSMSVNFRGEEHTLPRMGKYQEEPDRSLREEAFKLVLQRRLQDREPIEDIFDELVKLRTQMGQNAGFDNYVGYAFKSKGRFDYSPKECSDFAKAVEQFVVPVYREIQEARKKRLKLDVLRPWDLSVDPQNRPPLKPFQTSAELIEKTHEIFHRIDSRLADDFNVLRTHDLLDLDSRKGKAPGGYQCSLEENRIPFIFMNSVGLQRDVETLLHEGGHAFHALAAKDEPLLMYRSAPIEFCEVASMSMELLAGPHLEVFYTKADANRARRVHLEGIIGLLPWVATIDAFQQWMYSNPKHSRQERGDHWLSLLNRFGGKEDWSGLEEPRRYLWQRQPHLFGSPFYYIEYGIAQLGALQVWLNSKKDLKEAVRQYRYALSLGRSRPLPELFEAAGAKLEFSEKTIKPLSEAIRAELKALGDA